jgi:hypothetical protein
MRRGEIPGVSKDRNAFVFMVTQSLYTRFDKRYYKEDDTANKVILLKQVKTRDGNVVFL